MLCLTFGPPLFSPAARIELRGSRHNRNIPLAGYLGAEHHLYRGFDLTLLMKFPIG